MAYTYKLIEAKTLTAPAASVTFTSIPATFTDLLIKASARDDRAGNTLTNVRLMFNASSSDFNSIRIYGNGSTTSGDSTANGDFGVEPANDATANIFGNFEMYIPNYAGSNYKSYSTYAVSEDNASLSFSTFVSGFWSQTAALTEINIAPVSASFVAYSTFYLYGIKNS